jgi:hypothetical protein
MNISMEKDNSFIQSTETRNIPINWELLEKNRNEKTTTKKRNLPLLGFDDFLLAIKSLGPKVPMSI